MEIGGSDDGFNTLCVVLSFTGVYLVKLGQIPPYILQDSRHLSVTASWWDLDRQCLFYSELDEVQVR